MPYPAKAIANFFIKKALVEEKKGQFNDLSPLKLLKMIYLAHGWNLAFHGKALIHEDIEAWQYGPVIDCIYHAFKNFGNRPITMTTSDFTMKGEIEKYEPKFDAETLELLNKIWEVYKVNSATQLSNWSHKSGSPWYKTWNNDEGKYYKGMTIGNALIQEYFKQELRKANSEQSQE